VTIKNGLLHNITAYKLLEIASVREAVL
jgi:hypothetical protein